MTAAEKRRRAESLARISAWRDEEAWLRESLTRLYKATEETNLRIWTVCERIKAEREMWRYK